ncbi:MAG: glycoside hydrolase family 9 protein [Oscillospiraceae bacterium]|nr:glycoside hydrolase family 9 protein [Oscillospiraceae bacterium]
MLKKTFGKRITTGVMSAAMLASSAVAVLPGIGLTASAAGVQMLGQTDFDEGVGLPWHTCVTQPAQLTFDIDGGTYNITIVNKGGAEAGGASRWDCQFRHRKLTIRSGNTYSLHAEVTADQDGMIYTKIGDFSGNIEVWHNNYGATSKASGYTGVTDMGQSWDPIPMKKGQKLTIDAQFTASQSIETAEWAFHFGGAGEHQPTDCFPNGTHLTFDNMSLINESGNDAWVAEADPVENVVHVNQLGYYTGLAKKATYHTGTGKYLKKNGKTDGGPISATKFYVINAKTGAVAYTGTSGTATSVDTESGFYAAELDFSDLTDEGTYYISMDGKSKDSYEFEISNKIYDDIVTDAVNYFYQNRAGVPISETYITSTGENSSKAALAHTQYGHNPDTAYIQDKWIPSYKQDGSDVQKSNGSVTATDGWYDAGDHGKYVVNGGISVWTLQNMYEWSLADNATSKDKFADGSGVVVIPETGNKLPDILDETLVELKFFEEMIVPSSYKMSTYEGPEGGSDTGKYAGMVFHKLHDSKWTGLAVHAWEYQDDKDWAGIQRIVKPPSVCATLNATACFAQASRLFKPYDSALAEQFLSEAKSTYEAAKANPKLYAPLDQAIGGGAYGDNEARDDFYWAACELFITTGDSTYLSDLEGYSDAYGLTTSLNGGENSSTFTSFNWGNTAGLGTLSLYLNSDKISAANATKVKNAITKAADTYVAQMAKEGFGVPYTGSDFTDPINIPKDENGNDPVVHGYEWGSNSMVINNAIVLAYAYDASDKDVKYMNGCISAVDYLFGRNALDFSFVTGYGTYHCINPHHRLWSHENDKSFPYAPSGVLSGGCNAGMQDPYVAGLGYKRGNIPSQLCYVDSIEAWSVNEVTINWNSPFAWIMSFLEDEAPLAEDDPQPHDDVDWGNVDCSQEATVELRVNVLDAVMLARIASEDTDTGVTAQGKLNADVEYDGNIKSNDLTKLLKYLAGSIPYSDLGDQ